MYGWKLDKRDKGGLLKKMILFIAIIIVFLMIYIPLRMINDYKYADVRFVFRSGHYIDAKTGDICKRFTDKHGYYFYCLDGYSYEQGRENVLLSERTYSENVRWEKARECGADYFRSTTTYINGLAENGYDYEDITFIRETQSGQLYCITKTMGGYNSSTKYYKIPVIEAGDVGAANCNLFLNHVKKKEIYEGLYSRYMYCCPLDYGKEYGNHDLSFKKDKSNKRFKFM